MAAKASSQAPIAHPGGPYTAREDTPVRLDGTRSSDPDGPQQKLTYAWTFGDGGTGSGATPTHTYANARTYTVALVVTDHKGMRSASVTTTVTVAAAGNQPPVADAGGPYSASTGSAVQFESTGSSDPDGNLPLSYAWIFGDGTTGTGDDPTHTYASAGTYMVTLVVTDALGLQSAPDQSTVVVSAPGSSVVLVGAGDIAHCESSGDEATADLLDDIAGTVFTTGDNAYPDGTAANFEDCYEPSWGRHKGRTRPSAGNHEYHTTGAAPYFAYFGASAGDPGKGYYSYDLGDWHIVVLNSNIPLGVGSLQEQWLRADLAANSKLCTLAYWHHPLFSSSEVHGNNPFVRPLWDVLDEFGADVVLGGHDHTYERFAPQAPDGSLDLEAGIRQFVSGLGGRSLYAFDPPQPNSEVRYNATYGVLKLTLHATSYSWQFIPTSGSFSDTGTDSCH